jgi:hypothetical protein
MRVAVLLGAHITGFSNPHATARTVALGLFDDEVGV